MSSQIIRVPLVPVRWVGLTSQLQAVRFRLGAPMTIFSLPKIVLGYDRQAEEYERINAKAALVNTLKGYAGHGYVVVLWPDDGCMMPWSSSILDTPADWDFEAMLGLPPFRTLPVEYMPGWCRNCGAMVSTGPILWPTTSRPSWDRKSQDWWCSVCVDNYAGQSICEFVSWDAISAEWGV